MAEDDSFLEALRRMERTPSDDDSAQTPNESLNPPDEAIDSDTTRLLNDKTGVGTSEEDKPAQAIVTQHHDLGSERTMQSRFGSIKLFSPWFPETDPTSKKSTTFMKRLSHRETALVIHQAMAIAVLIFNIVVTIYLLAKHGFSAASNDFYRGTCLATKTYNTGIHVVINFVSSILLGSSSYCAQLLAAPTRSEVDAAHARHDWLDIGIPSLRNLRKSRIALHRRVAWVLLMITSVFLHLVWNSAIFSATPFSTYNIIGVTSDFRNNISSLPPSATNSTIEMLSNIDQYQRLDTEDCINLYTNGHTYAGLRDLVLVAANVTTSEAGSLLEPNNTILIFQDDRTDSSYWKAGEWSYASTWACMAFVSPGDFGPWSWCTSTYLLTKTENWTIFWYNWVEQNDDFEVTKGLWMEVDYCISAGTSTLNDQCSLRYNSIIMILVCILSLMKALGIYYTAYVHSNPGIHWTIPFRRKKLVPEGVEDISEHSAISDELHNAESLVTVGDAVASFLRVDDRETRDMPFSGRLDFKKAGSWPKQYSASHHRGPSQKPVRWWKAAQRRQWVAAISAAAFLIVLVAVLLGVSLQTIKGHGQSIDFASLAGNGLGNPEPYALVFRTLWQEMSVRTGFYVAIFFANIWQVLVTTVYLVVNSLITTMTVADEWNRFIQERKTLRMSNARGIQRSTYFLSLPLRYALPFTIAMGVLHWLISQSIFIIQVVGYRFENNSFQAFPELDSSVVGYSAIGIFYSLMNGCVLVLVTFVMGFGCRLMPRSLLKGENERQAYTMPMAGTCSAAISATCHKAEGDTDAEFLPLRWGFVRTGEDHEDVGQWCFTTAHDVCYPPLGLAEAASEAIDGAGSDESIEMQVLLGEPPKYAAGKPSRGLRSLLRFGQRAR